MIKLKTNINRIMLFFYLFFTEINPATLYARIFLGYCVRTQSPVAKVCVRFGYFRHTFLLFTEIFFLSGEEWH